VTPTATWSHADPTQRLAALKNGHTPPDALPDSVVESILAEAAEREAAAAGGTRLPTASAGCPGGVGGTTMHAARPAFQTPLVDDNAGCAGVRACS